MPTAHDLTGGHLQLLYGPGNYSTNNSLGASGHVTVTDANGFWLRNFTAVNEGGSKIWIMVFDATSLPSNGTSPVLVPIPIGSTLYASWDLTPPYLFHTGIFWAASSTTGNLTYSSGSTVNVTMVY